MSEYYEGGDNYGDHGDGEEIRAEFTDGSSLTFVDVDGDGYADKVLYSDGYEPYEGGHEPAYTEPTGDEGYDEPAYDEPAYDEPAAESYGPGYTDGYTDGGSFYSNENIDTAVSTNPGGDEGYIALGDGEFVSWG